LTSGYTRQSAAEIQTGSVILAASLNDEYDALVAFADANTGHNHDSTTGGGAKIPSAGLSGVTSTSSGLIAATGVNTFAARTLTGTANEITVTNGTGASGNPTLSLPAALTFTGKTVTGGTFTSTTIDLATNTLTGTVAQFNTALSDGNFTTIAGTETLTSKTIDLASNTLTGTVAQFNTALSDGNFATIAGTETLTNKTIDLTSNTLTGTVAQFNTALSDGNFTTIAGTETLTNKTIDLTSNTLTGTVAQFNTALSDGNFATIAGTETLTNKTIDLTSNTLTGTVAQFNTALSGDDFATLAGTETLTNKTLTTPTLTLKQSTSPTPTAEGDIQWDTNDDQIVVGDGTAQKIFSQSSSGTYTPTLFNTTNVAASTAYVTTFMRVGNAVTVAGQIDIDPTASAANTVLGVSLPIPSNFTAGNQAGGTITTSSGAGITQVGGAQADATNDRINFTFLSATLANVAHSFTFTYQVV